MALIKKKDTLKKPAEDGAAEQKDQKKNKATAAVATEMSFSVTEAYKALRTNINFTIPGDGTKSFLVTSAVLSEGKTTTSTSLALTIAQTEARVIIVDGDMRRPKVHSKFNLTNKIGLSNYLSGMCTLEEAIQHVEDTALDLIFAGTLPPNPAELLSSPAMEALVEDLKSKYDYVIIDTPPIDIVADALPVTQFVDGVVMVVRYHQSIHPEVAAAVERLEFAGAKILGFVLNGVEETTTFYRGHYKRSYRRYGYGYGSYGYGSYGYGKGDYGYGYGYGYGDKKQNGDDPNAKKDSAKPEKPETTEEK